MASSTVQPITLISSPAGSSLGCARTVIPRGLAAARHPAFARLLALDADDIRERNFHPQRSRFHFGHAPIVPPKNHRLLESFHPHAQPGRKSLRRNGFRGALAATPRSACDAASVSTTAASVSARAPTPSFPMRRPACFSSCARSARSLISCVKRATSLSKRFCVSRKFFSSSAMRFFCRSTHSVCSVAALRFELREFFARLALHFFHFVAAAMQIRDQVARLARFGRKAGTRMIHHARGQPQPPRDFDSARCSRHADEQPVRRPQILLVEFHRGIHDSRRRRSVSLQPVVVRRRERQRAPRAKFFQQRDSQRRAFFRSRARAHFVHQNQRTLRRNFQHRFQIQHVRGKRRKIRGNGLLVANIREHAVENRQLGDARPPREFPIAPKAPRAPPFSAKPFCRPCSAR